MSPEDSVSNINFHIFIRQGRFNLFKKSVFNQITISDNNKLYILVYI